MHSIATKRHAHIDSKLFQHSNKAYLTPGGRHKAKVSPLRLAVWLTLVYTASKTQTHQKTLRDVSSTTATPTPAPHSATPTPTPAPQANTLSPQDVLNKYYPLPSDSPEFAENCFIKNLGVMMTANSENTTECYARFGYDIPPAEDALGNVYRDPRLESCFREKQANGLRKAEKRFDELPQQTSCLGLVELLEDELTEHQIALLENSCKWLCDP